jgi:hypothetical protein
MTFQKKELKGSRLRCLMLTSMPDKQVAHFLCGLVHPYATVDTSDQWMPRGFQRPQEAKLGEASGFLGVEHRNAVTNWWLTVHRNANTPTWDIVSTCRFCDGNQMALILVEAKAHEDELESGGKKAPKTANGMKNHDRIKIAMASANAELKKSFASNDWALSCDFHYQISNRFAWAWKVASLGTPVILVYLGFLNSLDMDHGGRTILTSAEHWQKSVLASSQGIVPPAVWNQKLAIGDIPLVTLIRAADVNVSAALQTNGVQA